MVVRVAEGGVVKRDGAALTAETLLAPGTDVYFYRRPAPEVPVPFEIRPVFEDGDILVVDKPPFLATMPRGAHVAQTALVRLRREQDAAFGTEPWTRLAWNISSPPALPVGATMPNHTVSSMSP